MRCYGIGLQGATYIYLMGADPVVRIKPSNSARFGRSGCEPRRLPLQQQRLSRQLQIKLPTLCCLCPEDRKPSPAGRTDFPRA